MNDNFKPQKPRFVMPPTLRCGKVDEEKPPEGLTREFFKLLTEDVIESRTVCLEFNGKKFAITSVAVPADALYLGE